MTAAGAAMGVALLLILAVVTFVLYVVVQRALEPTEELDPTRGSRAPPPPIGTVTTENTGGGTAHRIDHTRSILVRPTSVTSSSALKATSTDNYRATNLVDGDLTTAWNEGAEGPGLGEWVKFEFSQQLVLARIEIANGYQKDEERFLGNPRVKSLKVEYSNGTTQLVDLLDTEEPPDHHPHSASGGMGQVHHRLGLRRRGVGGYGPLGSARLRPVGLASADSSHGRRDTPAGAMSRRRSQPASAAPRRTASLPYFSRIASSLRSNSLSNGNSWSKRSSCQARGTKLLSPTPTSRRW